MTTRDDETPLPCPWCGEEIQRASNHDDPDSWSVMHWAQCRCGASGPARPTRAAAIAAWNRVARAVKDLEAHQFAMIEMEHHIDEAIKANDEIAERVKAMESERENLRARVAELERAGEDVAGSRFWNEVDRVRNKEPQR